MNVLLSQSSVSPWLDPRLAASVFLTKRPGHSNQQLQYAFSKQSESRSRGLTRSQICKKASRWSGTAYAKSNPRPIRRRSHANQSDVVPDRTSALHMIRTTFLHSKSEKDSKTLVYELRIRCFSRVSTVRKFQFCLLCVSPSASNPLPRLRQRCACEDVVSFAVFRPA